MAEFIIGSLRCLRCPTTYAGVLTALLEQCYIYKRESHICYSNITIAWIILSIGRFW